MKILSIDPGTRPGYVVLEGSVVRPRRYFRGQMLPAICAAGLSYSPDWGPIDAVVVEGQWLAGAQKKEAVLQLAIRAGWQLHEAASDYDCPAHVIRVATWRAALGGKSASKTVLQNRCELSLEPIETAVLAATGASPTRLGDLLDAILIGWGFHLSPQRSFD